MTEHKVVFRTVQKSPGLLGRTVGPTLSTQAEAKKLAERFAEEKLNAVPTTWREADDGSGTLTMNPSATRHTLSVEAVTIHESADDLMGVLEADD